MRPTSLRSSEMVGDVRVTASIVVGADLRLTRPARVALPSGQHFRDFMATFSRQQLVQLFPGEPHSRKILVRLDFEARVIEIRVTQVTEAHLKSTETMSCLTGVSLSENEADVTLSCDWSSGHEGHQVRGHRSVLVQRNAYLASLWETQPPSRDHVEQLPVSWSTLLTLWHYSYSAVIVIDPQHLLQLLEEAVYLQLDDVCFAIGTSLSLENVHLVRRHCIAIEARDVADMCDFFIRSHWHRFFRSDLFVNLSVESVTDFVSDESLTIPESRLWRLCITWLEAEVRRQEASGNRIRGVNRLRSLMPFLNEFRFDDMSLQELVDGPISSMLLTRREIHDILHRRVHGGSGHLFYSGRRVGQVRAQAMLERQAPRASKKGRKRKVAAY